MMYDLHRTTFSCVGLRVLLHYTPIQTRFNPANTSTPEGAYNDVLVFYSHFCAHGGLNGPFEGTHNTCCIALLRHTAITFCQAE